MKLNGIEVLQIEQSRGRDIDTGKPEWEPEWYEVRALLADGTTRQWNWMWFEKLPSEIKEILRTLPEDCR